MTCTEMLRTQAGFFFAWNQGMEWGTTVTVALIRGVSHAEAVQEREAKVLLPV